MFKHKRSQAGFGIVEALCFIVMFSMVGLIGWYVINENQNSQETLDNIGGAEVQTSSSKTGAAGDKFNFKEFGVTITLPDELKNMTYEVFESNDSKNKVIELYSPEFTTLADVCLSRDPVAKHPFRVLHKNQGQHDSDPFGTLLKQFKDFNITAFEGTGIGCEDVAGQAKADEFKKLNSTLNSALEEAFKTATLVE